MPLLNRRSPYRNWRIDQAWGQNFEINKNSPQYPGLAVWWSTLRSSGVGVLQDMVLGNRLAISSSTPVWDTDSKLGPVLGFDGVDDAMNAADNAMFRLPSTEITLIFIGEMINIFDSWGIVFQKKYAGGDPWTSYILQRNGAGANSLLFALSTGAGGSNTTASIAGVPDDVPIIVFCQWGGTLGTTMEISGWRLDTRVALNTASNTFNGPIGYSTQPFELGGIAGAQNAGFRVSDVRVYDRAFAASEKWQMYSEPWDLYLPQRRAFFMFVPTGPQTITMGLLNITGAAQSMTLAPGAVTMAMDALGLTGAAQSLTWSGVYTAAMDALGLTGAAQSLTVIPGAITISVDALNIAGVAQSITLSLGAVSLTMDTLNVAGVAQSLTVSPGTYTATMDLLGITGAAQSATVVPGAVTKAMDALGLTGAAQSLTVTPGAVSLAMDLLNLSSVAQSLTVQAGLVVLMDMLGLTGVAQSLGVSPGAVTLTMDRLDLASAILALSVVVTGAKLDVDVSDALVNALVIADVLLGGVTVSDALVSGVSVSESTR